MSFIDHKTSIPLFAAFCAMPFIAGGIIWLASIDHTSATGLAKATRVEEQTEQLERLVKEQTRLMIETRNDVSWIKEYLRKNDND